LVSNDSNLSTESKKQLVKKKIMGWNFLLQRQKKEPKIP